MLIYERNNLKVYNISKEILEKLYCPVCKSNLKKTDNKFICLNSSCNAIFPVIDGIPILINESNSLFSISRYLNKSEVLYKKSSKFSLLLFSILPQIGRNLKANENYKKFATLLLEHVYKPKILVLGGGTLGEGIQYLLQTGVELVESDVTLTPRTQIVLDAHDIPFENETFDGIVAQAVLEHVVNPYRCVEEMYRVLKKEGLIYAEIPFMQQVHVKAYDFTRFTHLGLRQLLKRFKEISSGGCSGPGMALAWSIQYFFLSFTTNKVLRLAIEVLTRLTLFPLKYFDYLLINKPSALDAASGLFFMGKKGYLQ